MQYLFILKQSPYQSSLARESLDFALASAAFNQQVSLLFMDDGIYQLLQQQQSQVGKKNIEKTLASLEMFDINNVYCSANCLKQRNIDTTSLSLDVKVADNGTIKTLIHSVDKVFSF